MIIVIDGPAGAGKSTTAKAIARKTGFDYVDSGAVYRGFTYLFLSLGTDQTRFLETLDDHKLHFEFNVTEARAFLSDKEITHSIRTDEVNNLVSDVAAMAEVRSAVQRILRKVSSSSNVILEGRDLGTVVFPDADYKFFLTADPAARAKRRYNERIQTGEQVSLDEIRKSIERRDHIDSNREIAPLKKAEDAIELDSTTMTFEEQVAQIMQHINN